MKTARRGRGADDLFEPTLQEHAAPGSGAEAPWRVGSQVYVAFFGGPPAAGVIAFLNSQRLRLPELSRVLIVAATVVGCVATAVALAAGLERPSWQIGGFVTYGLVYLVQRRADRAFELYGGDYESLWGHGAVAAAIGFVIGTSVVGASA